MAAGEGTNLMTQGRIVWTGGDLFKGRPETDFNTKQPKLDRQGKQKIQWSFGLAVEIPNPQKPGQSPEELTRITDNFNKIWNAMHEEAFKVYPSRQLPPLFSMKFKNGNTDIDDKGQPFSIRKGYAGHIVVACSTNIPLKFFRWENGANTLINEGIKCGDYVNVHLNIKGHGPVGQGRPGLYINPFAVQFVAYGEEIVNVPSGDQIFGMQAPVVPMGGSMTPLAPPQGGINAAPPQAASAPHYGVLPQQFQQPAQAPAPQPQAMPMSFAPQPTPQMQQQAMPQPTQQAQAPAQAPGFPQVPGFPQPQ